MEMQGLKFIFSLNIQIFFYIKDAFSQHKAQKSKL